MVSLEQQLSTLADQLSALRDAIPVDADAAGVTVERHQPGNGKTYLRLRAKKGHVLPNGQRTNSIDAEDAAVWEQKIYARSQQAKVEQCLSLIQKAADIAGEISWDFGKSAHLVTSFESVTKTKKKKAKTSKKKAKPTVTLKYVLKDAKSATTMNRRVHAISEAEPPAGRWYAPALCGEQPKAGSWGWRTCDASELDCPECYDKIKMLS